MQPNLIPVQRPDINGKMVTRWVKGDYKSSLARSIPAPKVESDPNGELFYELVRGVDSSISDQGINKDDVLGKVLQLIPDSMEHRDFSWQ